MSRGRSLYLLPGLICNQVTWEAQVRDLTDFDVVAVEGYGNARSLEAMAQGVLESAQAAFCLAGHSMGARVALEIFRMAPERVERLALLDTGVHPVEPGEKEKRMELLEIGRRQGMEALVDHWLPPMVHPARRSDERLMEPLRRMCLSVGLAQFENGVAALLARPDQRPILSRIGCPALVGVGREDAWSPVEQHREIAAAISDAEFVIFEGAGHMAPVEAPDAVTDALRHWLDREPA